VKRGKSGKRAMTKKKMCVIAGAAIGVVAASVVAAKRARGLYDVPDRDS
jgi:hypothetical protein